MFWMQPPAPKAGDALYFDWKYYALNNGKPDLSKELFKGAGAGTFVNPGQCKLRHRLCQCCGEVVRWCLSLTWAVLCVSPVYSCLGLVM